jgi:hypothetical protein
VSDHKGARQLIDASCLIGDRGDDKCQARLRVALTAKAPSPCMPSSKSRKRPYPYDNALRRQCHVVEKRKDKWRVATRYDRCAQTFFSAICMAATVVFWL